MKKLNSKGFAISTLIYGVLILFVLIMSVLIATLNFRYRSLSDISSRAENMKSKYFLNVGINLYTNEEYITPHSGTYNFEYKIPKEDETEETKTCSVFLEKNTTIKHVDGNLFINDSPVDNCDFNESLYVMIKSIEHTNILINDKSDANIPDLRNGLVPVIYDEEKEKWVITSADDPNWYNYDEQKWANAVSLDLSTIEKQGRLLLDGKPRVGEELAVPTSSSADSDVLAMFVWIPRYSYTIGCTNINGDSIINTDMTKENKASECLGYKFDEKSSDLSYTNDNEWTLNIKPGAIDIKFVSIDVKDMYTEGKPHYTYTFDDVRTPSNYYTHPAFTFDGNELSGIWVGKFETSTESISDCYSSPNADNCNNSDQLPRILPNVKSLRYQNVYNQFETARKFSNDNNIYKIKGDAHLMKNNEWGAVAYLSQSIYGKYGNKSYVGDNKEIYINNYNGYYTGISAGTINEASSDEIACRYNENGENRSEGIGECGPGASTTGNIYGIYDMSGGVYDRVMAVYDDIYSSSGLPVGWFNVTENKKYYDKYTITNIFSSSDIQTLGHANSETRRWYNDSTKKPNTTDSWIYRGGRTDRTIYAGIFMSENAEGYATPYSSFRVSLIN